LSFVSSASWETIERYQFSLLFPANSQTPVVPKMKFLPLNSLLNTFHSSATDKFLHHTKLTKNLSFQSRYPAKKYTAESVDELNKKSMNQMACADMKHETNKGKSKNKTMLGGSSNIQMERFILQNVLNNRLCWFW
ncbi:hypothetical protein Tsp_08118, partial [Trichinella spiralis]|uniref:hypothetical protein n=1 Tax=Trichinella spiralis TaxID=6334 RepID=UPI0001EFE4A3